MEQRYTDGTCAHDEQGKVMIAEDRACSVFCHAAFCKCPAMACDT